MGSKNLLVTFTVLLLAALPLVLAGCDADSPSAPDQPREPGTPPAPSTWSITVSLSPAEVPAGSTEPVTVTVRIRNRNTGAPPPNGTTTVLAASAGTLASNVVQLLSGRATTTFTPPPTQGDGTVVIQARLEGDVGQATLRILEPATFFLASVDPRSGTPNGGDRVTLAGGGFEAPVRVTFGGVPAQVLSVSPSSIRVETPPAPSNVGVGETLVVPVSVTTNLNQEEEATDTLPSAFTFVRGGGAPTQPAIFSVSPASGPNEGGTRVVINGEGFQQPVQVFFGSGSNPQSFTGVEASVQSVTTTRIVVESPPATGFGQNNLNEVVDILVKNLESGFGTVAPDAFQYGGGGADVPFISSVGPNQAPFTGGVLVTLFGQGFDEPVAVTLAGFAAPIVSVTGTEVVVRSPAIDVQSCADVSGPTELVNIETGEGATGPDFIFRVPEPVITSVQPSNGPQSGGTDVTLGGFNFSEPVRVTFSIGGENFTGNLVSVSPGEIVVESPPVPNAVFDTEPCDDNGDGTEGERFIATAADLRLENLVTTCDDEFEGAFTFTPTNSSCRNDMGEPPPPPPVECQDGFDNDGDGFIDAEDPECNSPDDDDESA